MPRQPDRDRETGDERIPELPPPEPLPDAPELKVNLPPRPDRAPTEDERQAQQMGLAYTLPASLVAPIVALTLAGAWLDSHFHMSPAFTLGGAILGAVSGFINMIRIANRLNR